MMLRTLTFGLLISMIGGGLFAAESEERKVDKLSKMLQKDLINKLSLLAKRYEGRPDEPQLLLRLLEAHQTASQIEFRLSHYESDTKKAPIDSSEYHKSLEAIIDSATVFIRRFPQHEQLGRVLFARGQSLEELKRKSQAKADYEAVASSYPETTFAIRSNLALAAFATEDNNPQGAIIYLKRVLPYKNDSHYPFALYQLAWASYNLKYYFDGLKYLKLYTTHYQEKSQAQGNTLAVSDQAYYEHGLRDVVTFFADGFEDKVDNFALQDAFPTFQKFEPGPFLGRMLTSFAKHLRSRKLIAELDEWKAIVLNNESSRPEALDIVMLQYDHKILNGGYDKVPEAMEDILTLNSKVKGGIKNWESFPAAMAAVLKTATEIQAKMVQSKNPGEIQALSKSFKSIKDVYMTIGDKNDPKLSQLHFNYAETLFKLKNYEESGASYQWVLENWNEKAGLKRNDITLRLLGSRYQTLLNNDEMPKSLSVQELKGEEELDLKTLPKLSAEWVGWVDKYIKEFGRTSSEVENFEYEANRLLYHHGQRRVALKRMSAAVSEKPKSVYSVPAASLILDTYLHNKEWEKAQFEAEKFAVIDGLGDAAFKARVLKIPDDTSYKPVEKAYESKDYLKALQLAEAYLEKRKTSIHLPACLLLASRSAQNLGDPEKSSFYLNELLTKYPKDENRSLALLANASIKESKNDFDGAVSDYVAYFDMVKKADRDDVLKRYWVANWLSKKSRKLDCAVYGESLRFECERYWGLILLNGNQLPENDTHKKTRSGPSENRAIWSAFLLHNGKKMATRDQIDFASSFVKNWKSLDALIQFSMLPVLNRDLPKVFLDSRKGIVKSAPLKSNSTAITRRIKLIQEVETLAGNAVALPWSQIKMSALQEVAGIYRDFSEELAKLPIPQDISAEEKAEYEKGVQELAVPFKEKGGQLKKQADEYIASIQPERSLADQGQSSTKPSFGLLDTMQDPALTKAASLRGLWQEAVTNSHWPRIAFFFQKLKDTAGLNEHTLTLMRAITLDSAGAHTEARTEMASLPRKETTP